MAFIQRQSFVGAKFCASGGVETQVQGSESACADGSYEKDQGAEKDDCAVGETVSVSETFA